VSADTELGMSEREEVLYRVAHDLIRAADLSGGTQIATKQALWKVEKAQQDLHAVRMGLLARLAVIQGAS